MNARNFTVLALYFICPVISAQFNFSHSWGTYFGDERFYLGNSVVDNDGFLYIVGTVDGSVNANFPVFTDSNSYQQQYGGGDTDGFIVKFDPAGQIVWGTFFGGSSSDKLLSIDIDDSNYIYLVGDTYSESNISTSDAFQPTYAGNGDYVISKFNSDGDIIWSTYYGGANIDSETYPIFNSLPRRTQITVSGESLFFSALTFSNNLGTTGVFQPERGTSNYLLAHFNINGQRIWCTYYGLNTHIQAIEAGASEVYVAGYTQDCSPVPGYNTYYGSTGIQQPVPGSCSDVFLSKFDVTGQREWSTYYGGPSAERVGAEGIAIDDDHNVLLSGTAFSDAAAAVVTPNAYQPSCVSHSNFYARFSASGLRSYGTYNGDYSTVPAATLSEPSGIVVNGEYNYNFGSTNHQTGIATPGAFKEIFTDVYDTDAYICRFDSDGNKLWGTYYGGNLREINTKAHPYNNSFYIVGVTQSSQDIATSNSYQANKMVFDPVSNNPQTVYNIFITHFEPAPLSINDRSSKGFTITPNPSRGIFTIVLPQLIQGNNEMVVSDMLGKIVFYGSFDGVTQVVDLGGITPGLYVVTIPDSVLGSMSRKIVIK